MSGGENPQAHAERNESGDGLETQATTYQIMQGPGATTRFPLSESSPLATKDKRCRSSSVPWLPPPEQELEDIQEPVSSTAVNHGFGRSVTQSKVPFRNTKAK